MYKGSKALCILLHSQVRTSLKFGGESFVHTRKKELTYFYIFKIHFLLFPDHGNTFFRIFFNFET